MLKPTILIHVTLEICFLLLTIFFVKILDGKHVTPALEQNNPLPQAKRTLEKPTFATSTGNNKASPPSGINSRTMPEARFSFRQARQRMLNGQKTKDRQPTSVSRNNQRPQKEPRNVPLNRHVYNGKYAATVTSIQTGTGELIITDPVMVIRNILLDQQRFPNRTLDATLSQEFQAALEKLQEQNNHTRRNKRKRSTIQRNGRNRQLRNQRVSRPTEVARAKINNRKNKAVENSFSGRRSSSTTRSTSRIQPGNIARDPNGKIVFNSPMTGIAYRGSDSTIQQPGGFRSIQHSRRFQSPARTVMSSDFYTSLFNTLTEADDPAVEQSPKNKFQQMQERQINVTHDYRSQRIVNDPIEIQRKSSNIQKHRVTTTGETSTQKQHSDKRRLTIANKKSSNSVSKSNIQSLSHRFIPSMGLHIPDYKTLRGNSQLVTQKVQRLSSSGNPVTFNVETNPQGDSAPSHQHTFPTEGSSGNMPPASSKSTDTINESFEPSLNLASGDITTVQHQIERPGVLDNLIANVESAIGISGVTDRRGRSHSPAFGIGELPTTTGHGDVNHATLKSKQQRSLVPSGSDPVLQKVQRYSSNGKIVTFDVETLPDAFQKESNKDINVFENPATQPSQPESHIVKAWDRKRQQTTTVTRYTPSGSPVTFNVETPATTNTEGIHENVDKVASLTSRKNVREVSSKVSNSPALVLEHPGEEQPAGVRETATIGSKGNDFLTGSKAKDILTDSKDLYESQSHVHITNERPSGINKRKRNSLAEKMDRLHTVLHSIMDELQSTSMAIHNKKNLITTVEELTTGMTHSMLNHNPSGQIEKAESNIVQEKRKQTSLVNQEISQQAQVVKHISPSIQPVTKLQEPHTQQKSKTKLKSRNKNHQHHQLNSKQHEHLSKIKHSAKQSSEANMRSSTHQHHAVKHQQQKSNKKNIRHGDIGQGTGHLDKNQQHQGIIKQIQTRPPQQTQHKAQKQKQKQKSQKQLQQFHLQRQKQKVSQEHKQQKVLKEQKQNEQQEHQPQQKQQLTHPKLSHKQQVSQQQQQSQQQQLLQEQQQQQRLSPQQQQQQSQQQQKSQNQQLSQKQQKSKLQQKSQQQQKSHKQQLSQQQQQLLQKRPQQSQQHLSQQQQKSQKQQNSQNQQMSQQQQHSPQQQKKAQQEQLSQQQQLPQQQRQKTLQQMSIHQQQLSKQLQQSQQQQLLQQQMPQQLQLSQHQRSQQQQQLQHQKRHQLKQKQQQQPQQQLQQQQFQQQNQPRNQHKQQEKHQTFAISSVRKSINRHIPPVTDITLHIPATGHGSLRMQIKSNIGNISYAR